MRRLNFLFQGWTVMLLFFIVISQVEAAAIVIGHIANDDDKGKNCFTVKTAAGSSVELTQHNGNLYSNDVIVPTPDTCVKENGEAYIEAYISVVIGGTEYPAIKITDGEFVVKAPVPARPVDQNIMVSMWEGLKELFTQKSGQTDGGVKKGAEPCHPLWKGVNQLVAKGKRNIQIGLSKDCAVYKQPPDEVQNSCGTSKNTNTDWQDASVGVVTLEIGEKSPCQVMMKWNKSSPQGQESLSFKEDTSISTSIEKSKSFSPHLQALWLIKQKGAKSAIEAYQLVVKAEADEKKGVEGVQLVRELITLGGVSPQGKR
ncbi:MAG: hypothetical protein BWK78_05355 [Thiotrichaceae bacterium IS1]|nr:MAG: hypothetical protein BWK78_05355 [Thiotrichaceae bacterium IS1]